MVLTAPATSSQISSPDTGGHTVTTPGECSQIHPGRSTTATILNQDCGALHGQPAYIAGTSRRQPRGPLRCPGARGEQAGDGRGDSGARGEVAENHAVVGLAAPFLGLTFL